MTQLTISERGMALIKQFEGLRLHAYKDCAGVWTIGYGHTGDDVREGLLVTEAQADAFLREDISKAATYVVGAVLVELTQGQFDALVDFCFNLGERRLLSSTLLRYVNSRDFTAATAQFGVWVHAGGKVQPGLVSRRKAEADMFTGSC